MKNIRIININPQELLLIDLDLGIPIALYKIGGDMISIAYNYTEYCNRINTIFKKHLNIDIIPFTTKCNGFKLKKF